MGLIRHTVTLENYKYSPMNSQTLYFALQNINVFFTVIQSVPDNGSAGALTHILIDGLKMQIFWNH